MSDLIKILAADDHKIFLQGLISLFEITCGIDLVETAENGDDLLELIAKHKPDIALVDLSMPGADTETIIQTVENKYSKTQLLALTMHMNPEIAIDLFSLGLSGYVLKECAFDELEQAIKNLMVGEQYISPDLLEAINRFNHRKTEQKIALTNKEQKTMQLVAEGKSNKEIARIQNTSERTVRFHLSNCFIKLNANNRISAVSRAVELQLI